MHRLFVAIRPPHFVRSLLLGSMGGISGARWQTDDQIHLTLRFIGEVDRHRAGDIHAALGGIHHPRFEIALNGLGTFDRRGLPETVWAGVSPHEPLKALHKKVDQALARVGVEPEQRAYLPHITLARLKRSSGTVRNLLEQWGGLSSPPFPVDRFSLFESQLTPEGAVYTPIENYPLTPSPSRLAATDASLPLP
ncbi:RNA 2',3'-cyclic phosphodiesterase [Sphingosinicella sp. CPCC 101087]|uniref:RNA 2',3'-cyclic phosphodiesterase n=1 Tax=Sphingosinicella sp. CPCC 101087 TaxID=2497754 RepID=UPI00101DE935|nr:RNA 2',3'-cyclic phosphodiesterase [Sphingosinicella sp. CPCC 101087]